MDAGVKRLPIAALGEKIPNVLLVGIIIAKQSPRKVMCKSGKHFMIWSVFQLRVTQSWCVLKIALYLNSERLKGSCTENKENAGKKIHTLVVS
jgi:hypothetical protein